MDITEISLKILSCIYRAEEKYGAYLIAGTLCGSSSKKTKEFGLDKLSTYGIVSDFTTGQVIKCIHYLMYKGLLRRSTEHGNLTITSFGKRFIKTKPTLLIPANYLTKAMESMFSDKLLPTHLETWGMWEQGKQIEQIAKTRGLQLSTIESHMADLIYHHKIEDVTRLISPEKAELIKGVVANNPQARLKEIKDELPETITYGEIRVMIATLRR